MVSADGAVKRVKWSLECDSPWRSVSTAGAHIVSAPAQLHARSVCCNEAKYTTPVSNGTAVSPALEAEPAAARELASLAGQLTTAVTLSGCEACYASTSSFSFGPGTVTPRETHPEQVASSEPLALQPDTFFLGVSSTDKQATSSCRADVSECCEVKRVVPTLPTATAALLAPAEAPWTQNTARALRRAQQEVAELFAAQGLQLPDERAYCFDLVGTRAARGHQAAANSLFAKVDWPIVDGISTLGRGAAQSRDASLQGGRISSSCGAHSSDNAVATAHSTDPKQYCLSGLLEPTSPGSIPGSPAVSTPQNPAEELLSQLQQRRGLIRTAEAAGGTVESHSGSKPKVQRQQQQQPRAGLQRNQRCRTPWDELFSRHHLVKKPQQPEVQPLAASCKITRNNSTARNGRQPEAAASECEPVLQLDAAVLARAERSIAMHALVATGLQADWCNNYQCTEDVSASNRRTAKGITSTSCQLIRAASSEAAGGGILAPNLLLSEGWWMTADRPLTDPLLMCMPVWMRDALDLELMDSMQTNVEQDIGGCDRL